VSCILLTFDLGSHGRVPVGTGTAFNGRFDAGRVVVYEAGIHDGSFLYDEGPESLLMHVEVVGAIAWSLDHMGVTTIYNCKPTMYDDKPCEESSAPCPDANMQASSDTPSPQSSQHCCHTLLR
jgi:hypothetical protein